MTIQWLSSLRVEGLDAEKDTIPVTSLESGYSFTALDIPAEYIWNGVDTWIPIGGTAVLPVGGWVELGRTTLGVPASEIDVAGFADKRYLMYLFNPLCVGNCTSRIGVGNGTIDGGTNYALRNSTNGLADATNVNGVRWQGTATIETTPNFLVGYIANNATTEKLELHHAVMQTVSGAGTAPERNESANKWTNTTNVIDIFRGFNDQAGDFGTGSEVVILGWDPTDTHTSNFWEELASVDLSEGAAATMDTGEFAPKNFMWIQVYAKPITPTNTDVGLHVGNVTVDTGANYAYRTSLNGAADGAFDTRNAVGGTSSNPYGSFVNYFVRNTATNEKLFIADYVGQNALGEGGAPERTEFVAKWANTTTRINRVEVFRSTGVNYDTISTLKVWGHD